MSEKKEVDIGKIAKDLQLDKPVMSTRVVGSRIEVYLLGGEVVWWPDSPLTEHPPLVEEGEEEPKKKKKSKGKKK